MFWSVDTCENKAFEFKADNWLKENKDKSHSFSSVLHVFAFGSHMCLGRYGLYLVKKEIFAEVFQELNISPPLNKLWEVQWPHG